MLADFLIFCVLYLFGFVIFLLVACISKSGFLRGLFAVYVIGPIVWITIGGALNDIRNKRFEEERRARGQRNIEVFSEYCKGRKQVIHGKAFSENGVSLVVRIEKGFTGYTVDFTVNQLFYYLGKRPELCARTGVKVLEGVFDRYSVEKKRREKEVVRYSLCTSEKMTVVPEVQSKYELVLGQTGSKKTIYWGAGSPYPNGKSIGQMSNSSIQIVDRSTGEVLAEDAMYFLRDEGTGVGGCPEGMDQLSDLLVKVFGRSE
jgi:hypothetical protein